MFRFVLFLLAALGGCAAPQTRIELYQPALEGPQQRVSLASDWASAQAADGAAHLLLEYPLPGSQLGQRQFLVYLCVPVENGAHDVGTPFGEGMIVSGLLIQRTGRLRGMSPLTAGTVTLDAVRPWRGRFALRCADGSSLYGDFSAREGPAVTRFQNAHAVDIAAAVAAARGAADQSGPGDRENARGFQP